MKIVLYRTKIREEENFHVDEIGSYLSSLSSLEYKEFTTLQRVETTKLDIEIKIKATTEAETSVINADQRYDYARINLGLPSYGEYSYINNRFYFVRKIEWVAPQTYKVVLHMDVVNSFYVLESVNNHISPLTHITRQHKDRYKNTFFVSGHVMACHIDELSEGIIPPLYKSDSPRVLYGQINSEDDDTSWYLIYKSIVGQDQNQYIKAYLCNDNRILIGVPNPYVTPVPVYLMPSIHDFDLTDSRIVKVLKLPYIPTDIIESGTRVYTDSQTYKYIIVSGDLWRIDEDSSSATNYYLYRKNLVDGYQNENSLKIDQSLLNPLININMGLTTKSLTDMRRTTYYSEPKLYHSDFYYPKIIYDSFVKIVKCEAYLNRYTSTSAQEPFNTIGKITFYTTNTINSRFMFKFRFLGGEFENEDYTQYLVVARNNEMSVYSSEYLNYLRTGYNYDVKAKNQQETFSWFTAGLGIVGGVASVAFGSKTLGVAMISSSVMALSSAINNTITAERNLSQKINQYKMQSASVYGSDDVDLMTIYNKNNKLWINYYNVSYKMKKLLGDIFYYTGYIDDIMEIPVTNTRMWFNFIQCELAFIGNNYMTREQTEEMQNKFKGGVTFLHMNSINGVNTWNFERDRENWERIFFN